MDRYHSPDSTMPNLPPSAVLDRRRNFLQHFAPANNIEPIYSQRQPDTNSISSSSNFNRPPSPPQDNVEIRGDSDFEDEYFEEEDILLEDLEPPLEDQDIDEEIEDEELEEIELEEMDEIIAEEDEIDEGEDDETLGDEEEFEEIVAEEDCEFMVEAFKESPVYQMEMQNDCMPQVSSSSSTSKPKTSLISIPSPSSESGIKLQIRRAPQEQSSREHSILGETPELSTIDESESSTESEEVELVESAKPEAVIEKKVKIEEEEEEQEDHDNTNETSTTPNTEGTRRTGRKRKPTRQFVADMGMTRRSKREAVRNEDTDSNRSKTNESSSRKVLSFSFGGIKEEDVVGTSSEVSSTRVLPKGRPSTGRGRGRPRGSTSKNRMPHDAAMASVEDIVDVVLSQTPSSSVEDSDNVSSQGSTRTGKSLCTEQRTPRGSRTRGSRGGRQLVTPRKNKERKEPKPKPVSQKRLEVFDEDTLMNYTKIEMKLDSQNSFLNESESMSNTLVIGDDDPQISSSNISSTSNSVAGTPRSKKLVNKDVHFEERKPVTAETLFEYRWPPHDESSQCFMLQEQVSEYLGAKSFKRKYPDLKRRVVDMPERDFLRNEKIVTETQCDLGLTALYSNEVMDIMAQDFPEKYNEFCRVLQARLEAKKQRVAQIMADKAGAIKDRTGDFRLKLLRSASNWNAVLNKDRQTHRSYSFDLQSYNIHLPQNERLKQILPPEMTKIGYFPVATLPGQYLNNENVRRYTSTELKYLPLDTVTYGPLPVPSVESESEDSESDSDDSSSTEDTSSSSDDDTKKETSSDKESSDERCPASECTPVIEEGSEGDSLAIMCKTCEGNILRNKDGGVEVIIHCTKCSVPNHPSCLELSLDMLPYIRKYNWQCTECKNCIECNDPADEDKMLFCDLCDRGYHIYCVGLRKVPTGRWHCRVCAVCYSCGTRRPSDEDRMAEWHHEFKKGEKNSKFYLHSQCVSCHKLYKKGQYCPSCLKCHIIFDEKNLIECRTCEKWVHRDCAKKSIQPMFAFRCDSCEANIKARIKLPSLLTSLTVTKMEF